MAQMFPYLVVGTLSAAALLLQVLLIRSLHALPLLQLFDSVAQSHGTPGHPLASIRVTSQEPVHVTRLRAICLGVLSTEVQDGLQALPLQALHLLLPNSLLPLPPMVLQQFILVVTDLSDAVLALP